MSKRKNGPKVMTVLEVLEHLADDVKELEFEAIGKDGHTCLISKPQVLDFIFDYKFHYLQSVQKPSSR